MKAKSVNKKKINNLVPSSSKYTKKSKYGNAKTVYGIKDIYVSPKSPSNSQMHSNKINAEYQVNFLFINSKS